MDNNKVLPNPLKDATKNDETRQTQVFVLPPELLKGLLLQNKIPKINDPKKLVTVSTINKLKNYEKEENKADQLSDISATITDEINKIKMKDDETVKKSGQNSSTNKSKRKEKKTLVNKKTNQESPKKVEESPVDPDKAKQTSNSNKTELIKEAVESVKKAFSKRIITEVPEQSDNVKIAVEKQNENQNQNEEHVINNNLLVEKSTEIISEAVNELPEKLVCLDSNKSNEIENNKIQSNDMLSRHSKVEKEEKNIEKTFMQSEKHNLEITDESLTKCPGKRIFKNLKADEVANDSKQKLIDINKQKIESLSKNASLLENNVLLPSNESDVITNNVIQSNLETLNESFNITGSNQSRFSRQQRITKIVKPCTVNNTLNDNPQTINQNKNKQNADNFSTQCDIKLEISDGSANIIDKNQIRHCRGKRISKENEILKITTVTQQLDSHKKDYINTNSLPEVNYSEPHVEIVNKLSSDNLACFNEPNEIIHNTVQNNETVATKAIIEKEQINIDTTYTETDQPSLDIKDEFLKLMDVNQTRYPRTILKIAEPKEIVNASNDESKVDIQSQNKDLNFHSYKSPQKSYSKTIIEKYKTRNTEKTADANCTLKADIDKINIFQSCTETGNLNLKSSNESSNSIKKNQNRYSRRRRISKIPKLINIDKGSNEKSKTTDQSEEEIQIHIDNCTEPNTEESIKTSSEQIICPNSNETKEVTNNIIEINTTIITDTNFKKGELSFDKDPVKTIINDMVIPNEFLESQDQKPVMHHRRISQISNQEESYDTSTHVDNQETSIQNEEFPLLENNIVTSDKCKMVSTSEIQDESTHLKAVNQSRYPRRKRITRISKPNKITNSSKIKEKALINRNTQIKIDDLPTKNCTDSEIVEKPLFENMACLDSNKSSEVKSNIIQSIQVLSSDTNIQTEHVDKVFTSMDITINDLPTKNCINTEIIEKPSLENLSCINSEEFKEVKDNSIQNIEVLSSDLNFAKDSTKSVTDCTKTEEAYLEIFNKSSNVNNDTFTATSDKLTHTSDTLDKNSIVEKISALKEELKNTSKIFDDENVSYLSTFVKNENYLESLAFENENEEIEIIEEIEYIIEEVVDEESTETSDNIIVYDTTDSVDYEIEKSPIKDTLLARSYESTQVTIPKNAINSELVDNNETLLKKEESPIKNVLFTTACENNQVSNLNNSINSELNDSNEIVLNKKNNDKVNVYINRKKIHNETHSKENYNKSDDLSIETKRRTVINHDESEKLTTTILPTNDTSLPILTVRRYSARSCKKNLILNSSTVQPVQKELKVRNRSKSTNQVSNNESNVINTRTRSASINGNSSSSKKVVYGESENSKISKEIAIPTKAFKQENNKKLNKNIQALVEDSVLDITKTKSKKEKAIHNFEEKIEENNVLKNQKEIHHSDAANINCKNYKVQSCMNSAGLNVVTNEAEINLNYVNDEEDVTIDIQEILDSLAMDDSQDEDDALLLFHNNKTIEDEKPKSVEENLNKDSHIEAICEYNFNTFTNQVSTEDIQLKTHNKSQNSAEKTVTQSKVNIKNDIIFQNGEKYIIDINVNKMINTCIRTRSSSFNFDLKKEKLLINDSVEDKKTENMFPNINESTMENARQAPVNSTPVDSLEKNKYEVVTDKFYDNKVTEGVLEIIKTSKPINMKCNENIDKYTDNNKISASASIYNSKDKLDNLDISKISETDNLIKSNEDIKIETYFKLSTEKNLDTSKESDIDSAEDNYESENIPFGNDDCNSISSTDESNGETKKEINSVKKSTNLEQINENQKKTEGEFFKQKTIESQKPIPNVDKSNEGIIINVQNEQLGLTLHLSNIQEKNSGEEDSTFVKLGSFCKAKNISPESTAIINATSQLKSDKNVENVLLSGGDKKDIKRTLKQTSLDSFIIKRPKENTCQFSSFTEKISEMKSETSNNFILERDISIDQIETVDRNNVTKIEVIENDNFNKVSEKIFACTEEGKIEFDNTENKNQGNTTQINAFAEDITEKVTNTSNFILESDNDINITTDLDTSEIIYEKNTKIISENLDKVGDYNISIDKVECENNSILESDNLIDNPKREQVSEKCLVIKSSMDTAEIQDKSKDMPTTNLTNTQKRKRGRPRKSAIKIVGEKAKKLNTESDSQNEGKIEFDNTENKNQGNTTQISAFAEDITEKVTNTSNFILESDNDINITTDLDTSEIIYEKNTKIISENLDKVGDYNISTDKVECENNSILESDNLIDNPKREQVSEKCLVIKSSMDTAKIQEKSKDMPTTNLTNTQKRKRGRPRKSAIKIVGEKAKKLNTENDSQNKVDKGVDGKGNRLGSTLIRDISTFSEQNVSDMNSRKRRSCRLSLLVEPRRSTRHETDGNLKEVLNSSIKQKRQNRRSTKGKEELEIVEENTDTSINNNEDKGINKLFSENMEPKVKKPRGRRSKLKLEETSILNNQGTDALVEKNNDGDSSITSKTTEQEKQTCLDKEGIVNKVSDKTTNCDTTEETNINHSKALTENNATDTVLTDTRKRKRSTIKVSAQKDDEIESENDSMEVLNITVVEDENNEKELLDSSNSDVDESVLHPVKKRKGPLGSYRKRRRGKQRRGRPSGVRRKSVHDSDYVPHHSHLHRTPKKEIAKTNSFAELSMKKMVTCGKCDVEIMKSQWAHHNLMTHNDTGWIKGSTKPDFENDEKLYKKVINLAHKKRRKTLICEQCKVVKRSVAGYFSHLTFCGKSEEEMQALMVRCPICDAVTKPSSVEYHERMHKMEAEAKERMPEIDIENINLGPRGKRKAAEKAVNKISEFTALVKDDKENSSPLEKKLKINSSMKKLIQKPQLEKRIPSTSINKWRKDLANGQNATCSQLGCQFTSNSFDEIKGHYSICNFTPRENYVCKICRFQSSTEKEIVEHALEKHSLDDDDANLSLSDAESSSSDNSSDNEDSNKTQPQGVMKKFFYKESTELSNKLFKFIFKDGTCHTKFSKTYFGGFQWTLEFERDNYKFSLYEEYAPNNFKLLNSRESQLYLPELEQSMPMMIMKSGNNNETQPEWKTWKRFEGQCCEDNPTFFVGGPVWALAWLPIPTSLSFSEDLSQFIAISTHPTMDATYSVGESYSGKNIIQIWDVGNLNHKTNSQYNPKLAYAIIHEGGTVWCLEWCPSGCYQHKDLPGYIENNTPNKMGLLAAGCSDGCVRIYSLVFPEDLAKENSENMKNSDEYSMFNTEPVLVLVTNKNMYENKQQNWQVTKLSWSKEKNHNIIAAGFSNGYVALWDLALKSPLLKSKKGNTVYLNPYRHFFAHHHAITMIHLIPQENRRFLATASLDRLYKLWDLEDVTNPKNLFKKSFVTDGAWLNHWCTAFLTYDDALSMGHNYSYCLPLRDYTYKYFNIFPTNSPSFSISTSDYGNSIANGTVAGEILAIFPQQLIYIRDMEKTLPRKRYISMISTTEVVDFQKVPEDKNISKNKEKEKESLNNKKDQNDVKTPYNFMPTTYKDSKDRFGIKFYDKLNVFRDQCMVKPKNQKRTLTIEMMKKIPVEQYPLMSVNRLSWNPNASSFLWLAAGYQNGFVRLMSFKSMASPAEWSKLLTSHIETLKSDCTESQSVKVDDR